MNPSGEPLSYSMAGVGWLCCVGAGFGGNLTTTILYGEVQSGMSGTLQKALEKLNFLFDSHG